MIKSNLGKQGFVLNYNSREEVEKASRWERQDMRSSWQPENREFIFYTNPRSRGKKPEVWACCTKSKASSILLSTNV